MSDPNDPKEDAGFFRRAMERWYVSKGNYPQSHDGKPEWRKTRPINTSFSTNQHVKSTKPVTLDRTGLDQPVLFVRTGITKANVKQLRRGRLPIEETMDLHGMRRSEAEAALECFISDCLEEGLQTVLLVHGKGRRSEVKDGVLKPLTIQWLKQQPDILAFCEAQPHDGGRGALYVMLSSRRSS